ncbi:hypothetical protein bAD24_p00905 (plasmid) [Burkholderia sp. AD24]|nr:hypothetical protein bAD24_p00905 [Burkholderia sp. AD24]
MTLRSILKWAKGLVAGAEPSGAFKLGYGVAKPTTRMGRSAFSDAIVKTLASIGARPGDIVEVNEFVAARVVGRRPHLAHEQPMRLSKRFGLRSERFMARLRQVSTT